MPKALELAERVAANAPLTNFAVLQALPMIAEANPQTGLLTNRRRPLRPRGEGAPPSAVSGIARPPR